MRQERRSIRHELRARRYLGCVPGIWQDLELGTPEIARLGMNRINDRIRAGRTTSQGLFRLVVAGDGFEPS